MPASSATGRSSSASLGDGLPRPGRPPLLAYSFAACAGPAIPGRPGLGGLGHVGVPRSDRVEARESRASDERQAVRSAAPQGDRAGWGGALSLRQTRPVVHATSGVSGAAPVGSVGTPPRQAVVMSDLRQHGASSATEAKPVASSVSPGVGGLHALAHDSPSRERHTRSAADPFGVACARPKATMSVSANLHVRAARRGPRRGSRPPASGATRPPRWGRPRWSTPRRARTPRGPPCRRPMSE